MGASKLGQKGYNGHKTSTIREEIGRSFDPLDANRPGQRSVACSAAHVSHLFYEHEIIAEFPTHFRRFE